MAASVEWVSIAAGASAVLASIISLLVKQRASARLEKEETSVEVTLKVGETKATFDLNDPRQAADYLTALEQTKAGQILARERPPKHAVRDAEAGA